ncbi:MAG: lysophospholipid acyltransferase family protein [Pyrinomonadaceae bacterium]
MITARKSAWFQRLFALYNRNLMARRFEGLRARGLAQLKERRGDAPLVLYCNHSSWWDGLVAFHVSQVCAFDSYAMMEEKHLREYSFHRRLGAFSVVREILARRFAASLTPPSCCAARSCIMDFPQGQTAPNDVRPLQFFTGVARIVQSVGVVDAAPLALRYEFLDDFRPAAFLRVGSPERIIVDRNFQPKLLTLAFAEKLTQTLDALRGDILARDFAAYEELLASRRRKRKTRGNN